MSSYEQYPEEKSRLCLSSLKKKLINLHGGLLDVTTNITLVNTENLRVSIVTCQRQYYM